MDNGVARSPSPFSAKAGAKSLIVVGLAAWFDNLVSDWPAHIATPTKFDLFPLLVWCVGLLLGLAVLLCTTRRTRPPVTLGVVGATLLTLGSGAGLPGTVISTHTFTSPPSPDPLLNSYKVDTVTTNIAVLIIGAVVCLGALGWTFAVTRHGRTIIELLPLLVLVLAGAGSVVVAYSTGQFMVTPVDFTGRRVRRPGMGRDRAAESSPPPDDHWVHDCRWLTTAHQEAESIIAFLDLEQRLRRVGAPAELTQRCRVAARQEARHARLCCALARHAGQDAPATVTPRHRRLPSLGPLRGRRRRSEVLQLAIESHIDGVVGEGSSAEALQAEADSAADPWIARTLAGIAADEREHAALGEAVVRWCATQAPISVLCAVHLAERAKDRHASAQDFPCAPPARDCAEPRPWRISQAEVTPRRDSVRRGPRRLSTGGRSGQGHLGSS